MNLGKDFYDILNRTVSGSKILNVTRGRDPRIFEYCNKTLYQEKPQDGRLYCPKVFDRFQCWNYTLNGTSARGGCPIAHPYSEIFGTEGFSVRECSADGMWLLTNKNRTATQYLNCADEGKVEDTDRIHNIYISGYSISVALLLIAIIVFTCFRQLKCTRVTIHKHLFASYVLTGAFWLVRLSMTNDVSLHLDDPLWCKVIHVVSQYFEISNYAWMFAEGFYLHSVIVMTFTNQKKLLYTSIVIGWGFPIIPATVYTVLRSTLTYHREIDLKSYIKCWYEDAGHLHWVILTPIMAFLTFNVIILINVLRIIIQKMRAVQTGETSQIRKTLRACLILVPLLGIQKLLFPYRHDSNVYAILVAIFTSYQGFCVALLLCFFNREVMKCFKKGILSFDVSRRHSLLSVASSRITFRRDSRQTQRASTLSRDRKQSEQAEVTHLPKDESMRSLLQRGLSRESTDNNTAIEEERLKINGSLSPYKEYARASFQAEITSENNMMTTLDENGKGYLSNDVNRNVSVSQL